MELPKTKLPIKFKSSKKYRPYYKKQLDLIPSSTQMHELPLNTVVIMPNDNVTMIRYIFDSTYYYVQIEDFYQRDTLYLSGNGTSTQVNDLITTYNTIKPFLSELFLDEQHVV